jgi:hypothetical protein
MWSPALWLDNIRGVAVLTLRCRSGFARFTNCRFSMKREDITNTFIHLTNVAIQKHAPTFDKDKGMKWPIRSLRLFLNTRHGAHTLSA